MDTVTERDGAVTDYEYDTVGNLIETVFPNGVTETLDYNVTDQVQSILTTDIDGNVLASYDYTFDNLGNRLTETDPTGRVTTYDYNQLNQVIEVDVVDPNLGNETTSYEYDNAGNLIKKVDSNGETNYTYDDNDRLLQQENNGQVISYNYDDAGNLVEEVINGIITKVYNWNLQGELENATITEGGTTINFEYQYNSDGIRVSKTVNGDQTKFLIDRNQQNFAQVIEEYDNNGSAKVIYTHGLDLISQLRGSEKGYYHTDALGSTRLLTDSSGNIANTYLYDAYGEIINQSEIQSNSYKFTGEQFDPNLANYYLRARYYDPSTGRFTSRDSFDGFLERPLSLNDYLYTEGNPINAIDPSGNVALIEYFSITASDINQISFAIIGGLQGFSAPALLFIGNVLEGASQGNSQSDNFLEVAFSKTDAQIDGIIANLTRLRVFDVGGIADAFITGAGFSFSFNLKKPVENAIFLTGKSFPSISAKVGGFEKGADSGLDYIKSVIGLS